MVKTLKGHGAVKAVYLTAFGRSQMIAIIPHHKGGKDDRERKTQRKFQRTKKSFDGNRGNGM